MKAGATGPGTDLVLDVFALNGRLLAAGDALAAQEGLTSARWQVLGAIALAGRGLSVPQIARRMGLTRQSVQASVNRLVGDGMLAAEHNADHRRSSLFDLTAEGSMAYQRLTERQQSWITGLTEGVPDAELRATSQVLRALSRRLGSTERGSDPT